MKRIAVLTSGGDSPGMNPAIRSITRAGLHKGLEILGVQNGYQGLLDNEIITLDFHIVSGRIRAVGTFLQTSRCSDFLKEEGQCGPSRCSRSTASTASSSSAATVRSRAPAP